MNNDIPFGVLENHNLISIISRLSLEDYDYLTDCTRIVTMLSERRVSRFGDSTEWIQEYFSNLQYFGWRALNMERYTETVKFIMSGSVAEHLVQNIELHQGIRQGNAMIDTLDALGANKTALLSFDNESNRGRRFQVAPTHYDAKGNLHLTVFQLELISRVEKNNFLFWAWEDKSTILIQRRADFVLERSLLDEQRLRLFEVLRQKLVAQRFALCIKRP
ncbi:hypothetical protein [Pseudomonas vancouverensis]|uniref:Uncharacterized protein n=1 Tax=Pseudomonas vancouverensis TaxID=95300 RepID=A0A1H2PAB4_PSEVA|nr:hypothetical protein [Pseudomonas vancouverensis]KAB0491837.1 hypothetical protein F7R09_24845 [Pseudomonas vancouverensis]TDB61958.1 hypothetical protein EIY72_14580 [Pseudomonas vancouverensis]SDV14648.1 hypothetical protein SAMN05216558_4547 [Pseudomonas vancouverensis]